MLSRTLLSGARSTVDMFTSVRKYDERSILSGAKCLDIVIMDGLLGEGDAKHAGRRGTESGKIDVQLNLE